MITQDDFLTMEHNPFALGGKMMWEKYPYFATKPIYCVPDERYDKGVLNDILKFVVIFISPLAPEEIYKNTDFDNRMQICIDLIKPDFDAEENIRNSSAWYQKILVEYFKHLNQYDFESWFATKVRYHNMTEFMMQPVGDKTTNLSANNDAYDELKNRLIKMEKSLFQMDRLRDIAADEKEKDYQTAYAEKFALPIPENEETFF